MRCSGEPTLLRYVHEGRVSRIVPVSVVTESEHGVALFIGAGTPIRARVSPDGTPIPRALPYSKRFSLEWRLGDDVWSGHHVLMLTPAGEAHSFWAHWDEAWRFGGWYVNLQRPLRPTRFGWDTADDVLDLVVEPDLSAWRWKDEHELREAVELGRFTEEEAEELYREGERALARLEARAWPFDRDWSAWRPDPQWPRPKLDLAAELP